MIKHLFFTLLSVTGLAMSLKAQEPNDTLEIQRDEHNKVAFARFNTSDSARAKFSNGKGILQSVLQLRDGIDDYQILKTKTDEMGITHTRYQQYYKGVKVENAQYITHGRSSIEVINGTFFDIGNISATPTISETQALDIVLKSINAKRYAWEDTAMEAFARNLKHDLNATWYPTAELVIVDIPAISRQEFALAYKFKIVAEEPFFSGDVFINATTGQIIKKISNVCTVNIPCTGETLYNGTKSFTGDTFGSGSRLRSVNANGAQINTLNINHGSSPAGAVDFTDNNTTWTAVEHGSDRGAIDVHSNTQLILDYWKNTFNRNSLNGTGMAINSYFHWGTNIVNAAWIEAYQSFFYGDGGGLYDPVVAFDISAHEIGHGIDSYEAALGNTGIPGALKESWGDMCAAALEAAVYPGKQKWEIGEDIGFPLRYMSNPGILSQPDTYLGTNWYNVSGCSPDPDVNDNCGVHNNDGVPNYMFYLLSEGGSGTNDIGNTFSVSAIGIVNAFAIAYRAMTNYLVPAADFFAARSAMIQAARDLYGTNSCAEISTTNAWYAVGVGAAFNNSSLAISGYPNACSGSTYTFLGPTPVTWSLTPATGVANISATGNTATVTKVSNGSVTINAAINTCGINTTFHKTVTVGLTSSTATMAGPSPVYTGALYNQFKITGGTGISISSYLWTVPSDWAILFGGTSFRPTIQTGNGTTGSARTVYCQITGCGSTETYSFTTYFGTGGPDPLRTSRPADTTRLERSDTSLPILVAEPTPLVQNIKVYPNPSTGTFVIEAGAKVGTIKSLIIYNTTGGAVYRTDLGAGQKKVIVDLGSMPNGTYFLDVNGTKKNTRRIIIQR
jgi:Zn-dependent metalloprotease